ncbi:MULTISPECIES: ABC transporter ATP-binding protein [unclassified Beijerinckia]|uniref:ABC transporter ATP-binding protein n=1 Tax=unclassified Beijerinckia TaxID=2638183 RepID=UPI000896C1BC|nr:MULTISPECIES: ABC transporter ATP-binding protein [unclassified Beijerinckia]MDH7799010.1 branched-chain amino acid transport system ATP-binding protein [Beijerinckia sp. GAS462]SED84475.1 branched-chain amino acid transport system ATP-binding protein [Beijerinckia sp. 28-YEA-48]
MTPALSVQSLRGGYGLLTVFRDINLELNAGETIGILGPNGAGKTTILKTLAGALPSASGRVLLADQDVTKLPAYARARAGLNLVPEGRHILGTLSVLDNLKLTATVDDYRQDLDPFENRLAEIFQMFPRLRERQAQLGGSLSGGEQQMLAIARALMIRPKVLMLDEPTQGLAPIIVQHLAETLHHLKGRFAMIVVEQNQVFLERVTDRVHTIQGGQLN